MQPFFGFGMVFGLGHFLGLPKRYVTGGPRFTLDRLEGLGCRIHGLNSPNIEPPTLHQRVGSSNRPR